MKKGNIMRDVISSSQFTANVIKEYKKGLGDVVLVAITGSVRKPCGHIMLIRESELSLRLN
jgi:hypothetical protein